MGEGRCRPGRRAGEASMTPDEMREARERYFSARTRRDYRRFIRELVVAFPGDPAVVEFGEMVAMALISMGDDLARGAGLPSTQCLGCRHFRGIGDTAPVGEGELEPDPPLVCDAFPEGIPDAITEGRDHSKPYRGDRGIRFEPRTMERRGSARGATRS